MDLSSERRFFASRRRRTELRVGLVLRRGGRRRSERLAQEGGHAFACLGAVAYLQLLGRCGNGKDGAV
ncbi:hypothetical protein GCM10009604_06350 [Corynebacterium aurimucosum]